MLAIDHAIIAVADPEATADRLRQRTGLAAVPGGRHEGHGTGNWVVPLGSSYIELMTVVDRREAADSPMGRWVLDNIRHGDRLLAVCLRTDAIDDVARRIGHDVQPMQRQRTDGTVLQWRLAGLEAAMSDERLPFFIQWDTAPEDHPGRMPVSHDVTVAGITWVEFGGDATRLAQWLGDHDLPIRTAAEQPGPRRLAIAAGDRQVIVGLTGTV